MENTHDGETQSVALAGQGIPVPALMPTDCTQDAATLATGDLGAVLMTEKTRLFKLAKRMLRNTDDAADCLTEAYLSALPYALVIPTGKASASEAYSAYLYRAVRNTALDMLRKRKPTSPLFEREAPVSQTDETKLGVQWILRNIPASARPTLKAIIAADGDIHIAAATMRVDRKAIYRTLALCRQSLGVQLGYTRHLRPVAQAQRGRTVRRGSTLALWSLLNAWAEGERVSVGPWQE